MKAETEKLNRQRRKAIKNMQIENLERERNVIEKGEMALSNDETIQKADETKKETSAHARMFKLSGNDSDDSEVMELPRNERRVVDCTIKDSEWLKMFR